VVEVVPGPSAAIAALVASGLSTARFVFEGFLARKGSGRSERLAELAGERRTVVLYEAPHRLAATLVDLAAAFGGDRRVAVARELTKLHEEIRTGTLAELAGFYSAHEARGEITVILAGSAEPAAPPAVTVDIEQRATELLAGGVSRKDTVQRLVEESGLPRNEVYRRVMDLPR